MTDRYQNPLCERYASREMQRLFSADVKFSTWRRLWLALAESEQELGLPITDEQLEQMRAHLDDIDYDVANAREREVRHDVMAHIYAYGEQCPAAKPIIHLGATSCFVGDNTDLLVLRDALRLVRRRLQGTIDALYHFAGRYRAQPTLAYTHFQAAQPTTLGKRATLWMQDFLMDIDAIDFAISHIRMLGCRGATGTGASFLELFGGDKHKVGELERHIARRMGFEDVYDVSGQTYPRKVDAIALSALSGIAQSAHKFSNDIRLMSHLKEVDEPFESQQVGSSAMAYKRNPMRSERIAALSRFVIADAQNAAQTAAEQWFERTLDDSANKRLSVPEAFLAVDAILLLCTNIARGMTPYPAMMERHLAEELPFLATENILMHCVKKGGDRQTLHEAIREHSVAAAKAVKLGGARNDLLDRILADERFGLTRAELDGLLSYENFIGLSVEQTDAFCARVRDALRLGGYVPEDGPGIQV